MTERFNEEFLAILPALTEGDVLVIEETDETEEFLLRIQDISEDEISGMAYIDEEDEEEFMVLESKDFGLIKQVIINLG